MNSNFGGLDVIAAYKGDIARHRLLTREDEQLLGARAKGGDREAIDALVVGNLRLVMVIARKYRSRGVDYEDLVEEGNLGLIHAAHHFDPDKGRFSTYAYHSIERAIQRTIGDHGGPMRLPAYLPALVHRWNVEAGHQMARGEAEATAETIGEAAGLTEGQTDCVLHAIRGWTRVEDVALDEIVGSSPDDDDDQVEAEDLRARLVPLLERLSARDRDVITAYFGLNGQRCTLAELGRKYGMSKQGIQLVKQRAMTRLRAAAQLLAIAS